MRPKSAFGEPGSNPPPNTTARSLDVPGDVGATTAFTP